MDSRQHGDDRIIHPQQRQNIIDNHSRLGIPIKFHLFASLELLRELDGVLTVPHVPMRKTSSKST